MYIIQQIVFSCVYITGSLLIAIMLGLIFSKSKVTLHENVKFLFGFASTPFFIGMYMLVCTILPIRLWNMLYYLPLYILAVWYIFINREKLVLSLRKAEIPNCLSEIYKIAENSGLIFVFHVVIIQTCDLVDYKYYYLTVFFILYFICVIGKGILKKKNRRDFIKYICVSIIEYFIVFCVPLCGKVMKNNPVGLDSASSFLDRIRYYVVETGLVVAVAKKMLIAFACIIVIVCIKGQAKKIKEKYVFRECAIYTLILAFFTSVLLFRNVKILVFGVQALILALIMLWSTVCCINKKTVIEWLRVQIELVAGYTVFILIYSILVQLTMPVTGSDATEYLSNALAVVEEMRFANINSYAGESAGRLLAIIHHPNYVLYLGFASLHSITGKIGYPYDFAARIAFNFNIIYLIIAIWGLTHLFKGKERKYLCVILPFGAYTMSVLLTQNSRDGFRMIPLVILAGLLCGINSQTKDVKENYIAFFICTACVMMGHPINAIQAAIIVVAYLCWSLINKKIGKNIIYLAVSGGLGVMVGAAQIVCAFLETGRPTGNLINLNELLQNTDYGSNYMNYSLQRLQGSENFFERFAIILTRDYGIVMVPGLIAMIYLIVKGIKKKEYDDSKFFIALIVLIQSITISDIFSWSGFSLTEWYVKNVRYSLHLYVFLGILTGCLIADLFDIQIKNSIVYFCCLVVVSLSFGMVDIGWSRNNYYSNFNYANGYSIVNDTIDELEEGKELMIDNYFCNYYLSNRATSFFTTDCKEIRDALDEESLNHALKKNNIGAVMIYKGFISVYWDNTILMDYLQDSRYVESFKENDILTVYKLRD